MAEQEALKLRPGVWAEISICKSLSQKEFCAFVFLRNDQSILNKAKARRPRLGSQTLYSGEPSWTSYRTWRILPSVLLCQHHCLCHPHASWGSPVPQKGICHSTVFIEHLLCARLCRLIIKQGKIPGFMRLMFWGQKDNKQVNT